MFPLDANDPSTVSSATSLTIDLGVPNQQMIVCSGIAMPGFRTLDDSDISRDTAVVNLRVNALTVVKASVNVGLASFGNGDTDFDFAIDQTQLQIDESTQELLLSVDMAVMGNPSALDRFAYQVVAIITTQPTGISGTIRWNQSLFDATKPGVMPAQLFKVSAGELGYIPSPAGGFGTETYTADAYGAVGTLTLSAGQFSLPYSIAGAPYGKNLTVRVDINPAFASGKTSLAQQTAGPNPVLLTAGEPGIAGVDFFISAQDVR